MTTAGSYSDVEYVFEPHGNTMPNLREYVTALWERRAFMVELARADLRAANARTSLGTFWSVLDPLFQAAIYFFLYTVLRPGTDRSAFLPILIGNVFLFSLTTAAMGEGGNSVRRAKSLMLNSTFPRALLPVTTVYRSYRRFIPSACVFAVLFPLTGGTLGPGLFLLPLFFGLQVVMNLGIALLVSTFVTLVADANNVMTYITRILFFTTPVIYPAAILPANIKVLIGWMPLFPLFSAYQAMFSGQMPSLSMVVQTALWAFALLAIGTRVFLRREREFTIHL